MLSILELTALDQYGNVEIFSSRSRGSGRQTVRLVRWMAFRTESARRVSDVGIRVTFLKEQ